MGWAIAPLVSLTISIGSQLLLGLFKKSPKQEDPLLQTPKSDYGVGIPKIYGRVRLEGNKFFPKDQTLMFEIETVRSGRGGGKGGGRGQSTKEKKVYGTIALLYAEGPVNIDKIIIQGDHIETNHPFFSEYCTWFDGTQTTPWSVITQDSAPTNVMEYRGIAYLGIERMPLDKYGNQIPSQIAAILVDATFGAQPRLDDVVGDLLTRAGISNTLWDVTDLNSIILRDGIVIRQSGESYREAIETLMELYLFAPFQNANGVIVFKRLRPGIAVTPIPIDNRYLVPSSDGVSYISEIKSDFELPTKLSLKFNNNSSVYEADEIHVYLGNKAENENNVKTLGETLTTYPYEAHERAREVLNYLYSQEKNRFSFKLPIWFSSEFECLDILSLPNGQLIQITDIDTGADYTVEVKGTYYDDAQSTYIVTPDTAIPPPVLTDPPFANLFILDTNVVDNDLPGSLYCFADYAPATIQFSDNGGDGWEFATEHNAVSTIGDCTNIIGTTVDVTITSGASLESITTDQFNVDMGFNTCLIGKIEPDGYFSGEFLQYQTATVIAPNQYTLSGLKRNLNGTAGYVHTAGEKFFLFKGTGSYYSVIPGNASFIGLPLLFRAITSEWQNLATTPTVGVTPAGNAYKPPAPTNLTGIIDIDGNIKLFWNYSNTFSPYNNSQENVTYELLIDGIRTLTSNITEVIYLIADRTADGLIPPLNVTIWAISSVVGKGNPFNGNVTPVLVPDNIFGTGVGLAGIKQIFGNYTVTEADNNVILVGYTALLVEYSVTFPSTLSNGFTCWVVNAWGNNYASYYTIVGSGTNLTRLENNRIKVGDSRQYLHVSNGTYLVLGKNKILYDFIGVGVNSVLGANGYFEVQATGLSLTFEPEAIEGDFIGIKTLPNLDYATNPITLLASSFPIEGGSSFTINTADDRYLFYFAGTQWIFISRTAQLSAVAISGDYNDLINLPTLFSGDYNDLTNTPSLATVATSGDYNDLINLPPSGGGGGTDIVDIWLYGG